MVYIITYDLRKVGQNYDALYEKIKSLGHAIHPLQNLWILDTGFNITVVRDQLKTTVDSNDSIFVAQLYKGSYSAWMSQEAHTWLEARL